MRAIDWNRPGFSAQKNQNLQNLQNAHHHDDSMTHSTKTPKPTTTTKLSQQFKKMNQDANSWESKGTPGPSEK